MNPGVLAGQAFVKALNDLRVPRDQGMAAALAVAVDAAEAIGFSEKDFLDICKQAFALKNED